MVVQKVEGRETSSGLEGRTVFVPQMGRGSAMAFAAAFRSVGVDARISPDADEKTLELARRFTSGEECYPEMVTLGNFLKVITEEKRDPKTVAFFMPTADGPCRFGQYSPFVKRSLKKLGYEDALVFSPTSKNGYQGMGEKTSELIRTSWRALVCADILRKMQLKTRPYEKVKGATDKVYEEGLETICSIIETPGLSHKERLERLVHGLTEIRDRFREIPQDRSDPKPLIGIVGEIFCRHNDFSNKELIRKVEEYGGECWLSDITEWIFYTNKEHMKNLRLDGRAFSIEMLGAKIKDYVQRRDEHALYSPFKEDFRGYEEPSDIGILLKYSEPYLPARGSLGEMVLSVGKVVHLYHKGADGIIDISPFSCMNGIVSEAVYPAVSRDHDGIPIRNFYFDEKNNDLERDVDIFMELARSYSKKKRKQRCWG